ncbi:hypothetical protein MMC20_005287 [Loxospora ochrophaea]|nr:hypothetical protein [Loxospora ochrophaea]
MLRQILSSAIKPTIRNSTLQQRAFSVSVVRMAEGDTGAIRSGGAAQGDSFSKREKANEDLYVKDQERQKLAALKAKLEEQRKHLTELDKHIDQLQKESEK